MSLATSLVDLRTAGAKLGQFHTMHFPDATEHKRIFEFAVLMELVEQLLGATPWSGVIVRGPKKKFANGHGNRANFDHIEVGPFKIYFNVKFTCVSGVEHAPDVALVHHLEPDRPIHVRECKYYQRVTLPEGVVREFIFVILDLYRPSFVDSTGAELVPGYNWVNRPRISAVGDADALRVALGNLASVLYTTATGASGPMQNTLAPNYGCRLHFVTWSPT